MIEIKEINDERISEFLNLKLTSNKNLQRNLFIADGEATVLRLIKNSKIQKKSLLAKISFYDMYWSIISENINEENCFTANINILNSIIGFKHHSGVMASAWIPLEKPIEEVELPAIYMNGIFNADNVGSIVRNGVAFGIQSIIYDKETSNPYLRRAVRVSMGTIFDADIYKSYSIEKLRILKDKFKCTIIGAEITKSSKDINTYKFPQSFILIFGNEADGISNEIMRMCDELVYIPMTDKIESINVAAASAVILSKYYIQNKSKVKTD